MRNYTLVYTGNGPVIVGWVRYSSFEAMLARLGTTVRETGATFPRRALVARRLGESRGGAVATLNAEVR